MRVAIEVRGIEPLTLVTSDVDVRIDLSGGAAAYLQRDKQTGWFVRAAAREALTIAYDAGAQGTPPSVRLLSNGSSASASDLRITLSQVAIDQKLGPEVFSVNVPAGATPISLKELREAGPLGEKR